MIYIESNYKSDKGKKYKRKPRVIPTEINVTSEEKRSKKTKVTLDQKQIVIYSEKYAKRSRTKHEQLIRKAVDLIANPSKYKNTATYGTLGYISNLKFDKASGEIINTNEQKLCLNLEKISEEEKYDGYYAIAASELDTPDNNIIDVYQGLWRIEEFFKITKSTLEPRPIFLSTKNHINAHFLICFIALLIARPVEIRLENKYNNIEKIIETLQQIECSHICTKLLPM